MSVGGGSPGKRVSGGKRQLRNARLFARNPLCVHCKQQGRTTPVDEWDHIVPLEAGGLDVVSNLQGLCLDCHKAKTAQDRGYKNKPRIGLDGWAM